MEADVGTTNRTTQIHDLYIPRNSLRLCGNLEEITEDSLRHLLLSFSLRTTFSKIHIHKGVSFAIVSFITAEEALRAHSVINERCVCFPLVGNELRSVSREIKIFSSVYHYSIDPLLSISRERITSLPLAWFPGHIIVVETIRLLNFAISELLFHEPEEYYNENRPLVIGMDTEWRPSTLPGQYNPTCLLQLATEHVAVLFRLSHLKEEFYGRRGRTPSPSYQLPMRLQKLLQWPHIHKVGLGLRDDIRKLGDDFDGIRVNAAHDIQDIPLWLRVRPQSLQGLAGLFMNCRIDKRTRMSNWERPRLSRNQVIYAATDAWASLRVYKEMAKYDVEK